MITKEETTHQERRFCGVEIACVYTMLYCWHLTCCVFPEIFFFSTTSNSRLFLLKKYVLMGECSNTEWLRGNQKNPATCVSMARTTTSPPFASCALCVCRLYSSIRRHTHTHGKPMAALSTKRENGIKPHVVLEVVGKEAGMRAT